MKIGNKRVPNPFGKRSNPNTPFRNEAWAFIREPDLINRWQRGNRQKAACLSCNNCVEQLKQEGGLACRPLEPQEEETFFAHKTESFPAGTDNFAKVIRIVNNFS
jgi:hypothetical protein